MEAKLFFERENLFNHYVAAHPRGDVLQTTHWGRLKSTHGWEYYPLAVESSGKIQAAALLLFKELPPLHATIAYSPRGPLYSSREALAALCQEGERLCRSKKALAWKMDPAIAAADPLWPELAAENNLIHLDTGLDFDGTQPRFVMTLNLSPSSESLLMEMKSKTRYNIRYAARKEVSVSKVKDRAQVDDFYQLLQETAERDRFTVRPPAYFYALWEHLVEHKLAHYFLALHGGTPLAGAILFTLGSRAWYVYGASSSENRNLQASSLMQWEMIQYAKSLGCRIYDFRGVSGNLDPEHPLYGLYRFKEGFGAQLEEYVGEYDLPISKGGYLLWRGGLRAHQWMRRFKRTS